MSWTKPMGVEESLRFIKRVSEVCSLLGGPVSCELNRLLQRGCFLEVIDKDLVYDEISFSDAKYARQIKGLVEKQDFLNLGIDTEAVAWEKFKEMERRCLESNARLGYARSPNGDVAAVFHYAQCKIQRILGRVPSFEELSFAFGPGATTSVKMAEACYRSKLDARLACSNDFVPTVGKLLAEFPLWTLHHSHNISDDVNMVSVDVSVGKLAFVPKNSRTDRPIVVEPTLNGLAQKGYGTYMKKRLKRFGIDLSDQKVNQRAAWKASLSGESATVDLSSASDCVSIALVYDLLPFEWAQALSDCRTGTVSYKGEELVLEKFSSMGNGYTFELESLIFYALMFGVCRHLDLDVGLVSVYGDDLVIPTPAYDLAKEVLEYAGFLFNEKKSFHTGPFRESCGTDWIRGLDIRPYYLRTEISGRSLFTFHNWAIRNCERELAATVLEWIPESLRLWGPDGYGDGHLVGSHDLRLNRKQKRDGWCGGFFDTYSMKPRSFKRPLPGDWLVPAYSVYTRAGARDSHDPNIVRGSRGYAKISIYTLATTIFGSAFSNDDLDWIVNRKIRAGVDEFTLVDTTSHLSQ